MHTPWLALLLVLGCTPDPGGRSDNDTDTDSDTDAEAGPCPAYSGLAEAGQVRVYGATDEMVAQGQDYELTYTVGASEGDEVVLDGHMVYDVEGTSDYVYDMRSRYRCDARGSWLLSVSTDWSYVLDATGERQEGWSETTYEGHLAIPRDMGEGWTSSWTATTTSSESQEPIVTTGHHDVEVRGTTAVTVPAGSYDVVELETLSDEWRATSFLHRDLGLVRNPSYELLEVR